MKKFPILCLSIFLLNGCYYFCDNCDYVYPTDGKYYYPPIEHGRYTVRPDDRTPQRNCGYVYHQPASAPCGQVQTHQTKRPVGTVYEITTYETRFEAKTYKTGTRRETVYQGENKGCVDPCVPAVVVPPKEPVRKKPASIRKKPVYIEEAYIGDDDEYLIK